MAFLGESSGTQKRKPSGDGSAFKRLKTDGNDSDYSDVVIPGHEVAPELVVEWGKYARNAITDVPGEITFDVPNTHPAIIAQTEPESFDPQIRLSDDWMLRYYGFNIDWQHLLGTGAGSLGVYAGNFGHKIDRCIEIDVNGQSLQGVKQSDMFAAKYVVLDTDEYIEHFQSETVIIKYLDHPNIIRFRMVINLGSRIPVYSPDNSDLHRFDTYPRRLLIMEYADQGALEQFQFKNEFNNQDVFDDIIRGVCKGQKYMTQMCIVHNDLHAGNILIFSVIANDGRVSYMAKLSDFGQTTALIGRIPGHLNQVDANKFTDAVDESLETLAQLIDGTFVLMKYRFTPLNVNLGNWLEVLKQLKDLTPLEDIDLD